MKNDDNNQNKKQLSLIIYKRCINSYKLILLAILATAIFRQFKLHSESIKDTSEFIINKLGQWPAVFFALLVLLIIPVFIYFFVFWISLFKNYLNSKSKKAEYAFNLIVSVLSGLFCTQASFYILSTDWNMRDDLCFFSLIFLTFFIAYYTSLAIEKINNFFNNCTQKQLLALITAIIAAAATIMTSVIAGQKNNNSPQVNDMSSQSVSNTKSNN